MPSPLVIYPDTTVILPPCYCAPAAYYAIMSACGTAVVLDSVPFNKRAKYTHRTAIADTHGTLALTVPVQKPEKSSGAAWSDILVSPHNEWWHIHITALESAYGRTPFFEYYKDSLLPLISARSVDKPVTELDSSLDAAIRRILGIDTKIENIQNIDISNPKVINLTQTALNYTPVAEYYQIRETRHGFIPHLSVLDLIFNMGPEAPLVLQKMQPKKLFLKHS